MARSALQIAAVLATLVLAACMGEEGGSYQPDRDPSADDLSCTDVPPGDDFTCGEQVGFGKCDEPWMAGFCDRSCSRCAGIGNEVEACIDVAPDDRFTCAEQASFGKCGEPWMDGLCQVSCETCSISEQLIDPQASAGARDLMRYLVSMHGNAVLAGQQGRDEADHMADLTGRFPAIVGFDLMDYSPSRTAHGSSSEETQQALDWHQGKGGIVTLSWHWNAPANLLDSEEWPWWKGFYSQATTFDLARAMRQRGSTERQLILRDIDAIAIELQRLEDAGVPVLWRPIHEASGRWFWWGAHGPAVHQALWRLLYDRLVNHHGLHDLIWVWNGQDAAWYPGDQYVDIIAEDIYDAERNYQPQQEKYLAATRYSSMRKLVALSETGALLDPAGLRGSRARWSWFMLWSGHFANDEVWNEDSIKREVYSSDFVITLDELPALAP